MASLRECFLLAHHLYFLCLLFLTLLPLECREMLPLVSFPEVLKSLAVINVNVDSSLNSEENISNLESLSQVFRVKTVAWVGLFCCFVFYIFLLPSEFPKCFVVYAVLSSGCSRIKVFWFFV